MAEFIKIGDEINIAITIITDKVKIVLLNVLFPELYI